MAQVAFPAGEQVLNNNSWWGLACNSVKSVRSGVAHVGSTILKVPQTVSSLLFTTKGQCKIGAATLGVAACYGIGKTIWNRVFVLGAIDRHINPPVSLSGQSVSTMYNWNRITYPTATSLRQADSRNIANEFLTACKIGAFGNGIARIDDVMEGIAREKRELRMYLTQLHSFVNVSVTLFGEKFNLFGLDRNYQNVCDSRNIQFNDPAISLDEARATLLHETRIKSHNQWLSYVLLLPNYKKAVQLCLDIWSLIDRLDALQAIIINSECRRIWDGLEMSFNGHMQLNCGAQRPHDHDEREASAPQQQSPYHDYVNQ